MGAAELPPEPPERGRGHANADRVLALMSMMADGPVMMLVDTRAAGVVVPDSVRAKHGSALPLLVAWNQYLQKPIEHLMIDDRGVRATLGFGGRPFHIVVPWTAIWRVYSEKRNILYGECVPAGVVAAVQNNNSAEPDITTDRTLSLVPSADTADDTEVIEKTSAHLPGEWPALRVVPDPEPEHAPDVS